MIYLAILIFSHNLKGCYASCFFNTAIKPTMRFNSGKKLLKGYLSGSSVLTHCIYNDTFRRIKVRGVLVESTLNKWGNSLACRIPSSIAKKCGLTDQSKVEITVRDGDIVISSKNRVPVYSLEELVSRITPENMHDYADTDLGEPVGLELL